MHKEDNSRLECIYDAWKRTLSFVDSESAHLSPPLLLSVPPSYGAAQRRIMFFGQETYGWGWTRDYRDLYPDYPDLDYGFHDLKSLLDFTRNQDAVKALMWAYATFEFAQHQPITRRSPFWQAFREVQGWFSDTALIWNNCSRFDYDGSSILWAPQDVQEKLVCAQEQLIYQEILFFDPDICLFFTGPNYDWMLDKLFPGLERQSVDNEPLRTLCRVKHPNLPPQSFRTYHPAYLSRARLWHQISNIQNLLG